MCVCVCVCGCIGYGLIVIASLVVFVRQITIFKVLFVEIYVNVVLSLNCLYSKVSLTRVREVRCIAIF